ncbi:putative glycoside hydrolase [Shouchella rhizosphaerae]|uniref:putative glycoside hydrolase n=1 Tax=Shouchella rhizosphaerae TaxID=866786 RepID=UPI002040748B|nr:putative glycoside hydrolase [Shouchella rhizosphaerae]MCM3380318.1 putative glycoside hydrolase [Shouchella rhizosphaerae]
MKGSVCVCKWMKVGCSALLSASLLVGVNGGSVEATSGNGMLVHGHKLVGQTLFETPKLSTRFANQSGYTFNYPEDGVRGIYVSGHSAGGERFHSLVDFVGETGLNAMVIDIKDDHGNITYMPDESSPYYNIAKKYINDPEEMMNILEENEIYPIARIVVFKDTTLAEMKPELSFKENGSVWKNGRKEAFVNPFLEEVWEYNVGIAEEAAQMGFREIQFDYVRFPEGFENRDETLEYETGKYGDDEIDNVQRRVNAVTDFVAYAREKLSVYHVDVSVDIFGYAATVPEAPGIGQNFLKISENVDVISSMIYPSHWTSFEGLDKPDLYPYELTDGYAKLENGLLEQLEDKKPVSRPWIQDFTASYLGSGNYLQYGKEEVEAQIRALYENDINEFLLWNAGNTYTQGVDYDNP